MKLTGFSEAQQQAMVDLLVLGMYADGHLAEAEDARINRLLDAMEFASDDSRRRFLDAAITRVRKCGGTAESARLYARELAGNFAGSGLGRQACDILGDLLASDHHVSERERTFLAEVRETLQ